MPIGGFRRLVERVLSGQNHDRTAHVEALSVPIGLELQVFADHASEDLLVSARRRFEITRQDGTLCLYAPTLATEQIRGRRERKQLAAMLLRAGR